MVPPRVAPGVLWSDDLEWLEVTRGSRVVAGAVGSVREICVVGCFEDRSGGGVLDEIFAVEGVVETVHLLAKSLPFLAEILPLLDVLLELVLNSADDPQQAAVD